MSELSNRPKEENITHLFAKELSLEEELQVRSELEKDTSLQAQYDETRDLVELLHAQREQYSPDGIGAERQAKIFSETAATSSAVAGKTSYRPWIWMVASILFALGVWLMTGNQDVSNEKIPSKSTTEVFGTKSFNMALPSGTYYFTLKDGVLHTDEIVPSSGDDYFKRSGITKGDLILSINHLEMKKYKMSEWRDAITSQLNNTDIIIQIKRENEVLILKEH